MSLSSLTYLVHVGFFFWLEGQSGYLLLLLAVQSVSFPAWLTKAR